MKRLFTFLIISLLFICLCSCANPYKEVQIVATTLPVYDFTSMLCQGTAINVYRLINENISCLHNYTLQPRQMQAIENAEFIVINGSGLEDFLIDINIPEHKVIDASEGIAPLHSEEQHAGQHDHHHESDPHIWLSPLNAQLMSNTIYHSLCANYPQFSNIFTKNLAQMENEFEKLKQYADTHLNHLSCRELVTFHNGFSYMAESFNLSIVHSFEEESGSEVSAAKLIELIKIINDHRLNVIFTEISGSSSAANIVATETKATIYQLDMAIAGNSYFNSMYYNINTLKEALG